MKSVNDPSKPMISLSNYLMKKRKWPYRGWHKRYFVLQEGYLTYGKSEQEVRYSENYDSCICKKAFQNAYEEIFLEGKQTYFSND